MMQETMEKRANRTVGKSRQKDFFAVLLFFFLLPYTCSSVVRAGQEKTVETIVPVSGRTVRMQSGSDVRTMTEEAFLIGALAALETNRMLDKMRVRINKHYQEIMERDNFVTAEKVKNAFLGLEHRYHTLMQVFRQHNEDYEKPNYGKGQPLSPYNPVPPG